MGVQVRLLTQILEQVKRMAADLRELILANDDETPALVQALREADALITSLRANNASLRAENDALRAGDTDVQAQVNDLVTRSLNRKKAIDQWLADVVRK